MSENETNAGANADAAKAPPEAKTNAEAGEQAKALEQAKAKSQTADKDVHTDTPERPKTLTYMPIPGDPETTKVAGVTFRAYQPVAIADKDAHLFGRLALNPWFTTGDVNPQRKSAWDQVRKARAQADEARRLADMATKQADSIEHK